MDGVVVENIYKRYRGVVALNGISVNVPRGSLFSIAGPNGSGKSTLFRILIGLLKPDKGRVEVFGHDISRDGDFVRSMVGYMPQDSFGMFHVQTREAIYYAARLRGLSRSKAKYECNEMMGKLNLIGYERTLLGRLSGGLLRMAILGIATIGSPQLLLLDEPTANLDPIRKMMFWEHVTSLHRDNGTTILLVTHSLSDTERFATEMALFDKGIVSFRGKPKDLRDELQPLARIQFAVSEEEVVAGLRSRFSSDVRVIARNGVELDIVVPINQVSRIMAQLEASVGLIKCHNLRIETDSLEDVFVRYFEKGK
ncbi:MAG: ABC transporter ATP-binding protein [Bacilli bacterium]